MSSHGMSSLWSHKTKSIEDFYSGTTEPSSEEQLTEKLTTVVLLQVIILGALFVSSRPYNKTIHI